MLSIPTLPCDARKSTSAHRNVGSGVPVQRSCCSCSDWRLAGLEKEPQQSNCGVNSNEGVPINVKVSLSVWVARLLRFRG